MKVKVDCPSCVGRTMPVNRICCTCGGNGVVQAEIADKNTILLEGSTLRSDVFDDTVKQFLQDLESLMPYSVNQFTLLAEKLRSIHKKWSLSDV